MHPVERPCHATTPCARPSPRLLSSSAFLLAVSAALAVETAERFKIVLLPDTQKYTEMAPGADNPYFVQTQWIENNAESANIQFVTHLGDIVNDRNVLEPVGSRHLGDVDPRDRRAVVPYSVAPGNHDVEGSGSPFYWRDTSNYNAYFGVDRFEDQPWYGGHYGSNNDNNVSLFSVGSLDFMVVSLEVLPRDGALDWADKIIKRNPNRRVIVETHKYLKPDGTRYTDSVYSGLSGNSGEQIFDKLIKTNPNVFMVVCGHVTEEGFHIATNDAGGQVFELLTRLPERRKRRQRLAPRARLHPRAQPHRRPLPFAPDRPVEPQRLVLHRLRHGRHAHRRPRRRSSSDTGPWTTDRATPAPPRPSTRRATARRPPSRTSPVRPPGKPASSAGPCGSTV